MAEGRTTLDTVKKVLGHCNYFMWGTFETQDFLQKQLDRAEITDWKAGYSHHVNAMPEGAVRVGQVKVHHGDQEYPLWVKPTNKEA